jgi:hypothetical protein
MKTMAAGPPSAWLMPEETCEITQPAPHRGGLSEQLRRLLAMIEDYAPIMLASPFPGFAPGCCGTLDLIS